MCLSLLIGHVRDCPTGFGGRLVYEQQPFRLGNGVPRGGRLTSPRLIRSGMPLISLRRHHDGSASDLQERIFA
jgi:hypothetical protein